jgi:hypothetical protein
MTFFRWNYVLPDRADAAKADALDSRLAILTDHLRPRLQIQHAGFNRPEKVRSPLASSLNRSAAMGIRNFSRSSAVRHSPAIMCARIGSFARVLMRAPTRPLPLRSLDHEHIGTPRPMHHRRTAHRDERSETPIQTLLESSFGTKIYFRDFLSKCRDSYFPFRAHRLTAYHRFRQRMSLRLVRDTKSRFLMLE